MRILFYIPFSSRSRDTESVMVAFKNQGHHVVSLNQTGNSQIHSYLRSQGIATYEYPVRAKNYVLFYIKHIWHFISFCRRQKIDIVYAHLEPASFVAVVSQYFIRAKIYVCRHHEDLFGLTNRDQYLTYKITYWLARKIIVVSGRTKKYMVEKEGIQEEKIIKINLGYDFSLYRIPSADEIRRIKEALDADIVLITIGQLIEPKRPRLSIEILAKLLEKGIKAKLILLGRGEKLSMLKDAVTLLGLSEHVVLPGHVDDVMPYIAAATYLVHPSISESSCVVVKEAALMTVPVIVAKGVGDFDDYIESHVNGFTVDKSRFVDESVDIIVEYASKPDSLKRIATNLKSKVFQLFAIENTIKDYKDLNV